MSISRLVDGAGVGELSRLGIDGHMCLLSEDRGAGGGSFEVLCRVLGFSMYTLRG